MKVAIKFNLAFLMLLKISFSLQAQSFEDCSFYYSISTEDRSGVKIQPETYRIYYNNQDINPYITKTSDDKKPAEKGGSYALFAKDGFIYMRHSLDNDLTTLKIASLNSADTLPIDEDYEYPMMMFPFGEKSVLSKIEKVAVFGFTIDAYVVKFIQNEDNYTLLYLHKENLLPLKYEIIQANSKKNVIKNKIIVQIERAAGLYINGLAEFSMVGPVYAGNQEVVPN